MESIEKLRGWETSVLVEESGVTTIGKMCDEIEAEIERDYMKLPVDADGVPIHVGDVMKLKQGDERIGTVTAVGKRVEARAWVLPDGKNVSISYIASGIKHVKQRPIEDVLREFAEKAVCGNQYGSLYADEEEIAKYADELRELMEVGK